jgi:hypothetical protein
MKELQIIGLVSIGNIRDSSHENYIELKEEFKWVHEERFHRLLERAYPSPYIKYQKQPQQQHTQQQLLPEDES